MNASCPLCGKSVVSTSKMRLLNGVAVCKKCSNGFASRRQMAYIVDNFAYYLVSQFVMAIVMSVGIASLAAPNAANPATPPTPAAMFTIFASTMAIGYALWVPFLLKDGFGGASPEKRLFGLRVVDATTREPIGYGASFKRNLVLMVPFAPLVLAFTLVKGTRWGDEWANTVVIWKKYSHTRVFDPRGIACTGCGYDLTGNESGRCPECFTPVPVSLYGTFAPGEVPVARVVT